mgnify:CR=1 FL=1
MKVVIAIDSFKGSLTSLEAGNSAAAGIRRVFPDAECIVRPLADGGEGTVEALVAACNGKKVEISVTGPLGEPVLCQYGLIEKTKTAIIEMSGAAGITLVPASERNPLFTTTYGVGEVIRDAIEKGCRRFIVGIGGSATNDGGTGMLQALGFSLLNKTGKPIRPGALGLKDLAFIDDKNVLPELKDCTFRIACDVTNPLCGEKGCSAVFGPQKGADRPMIQEMDQWLARYAALATEKYPAADPSCPGAGAAGGLGFAFLTFLHGKLESGIQIVLDETRLADYVKDADLVITGEGRLDGQTVFGKAPIGVAKTAKQYGKTVLAFSGCVTTDASACNTAGIDAFFPILRTVTSLEEAMDPRQAMKNMEDTVEQVFRVIKTFHNLIYKS